MRLIDELTVPRRRGTGAPATIQLLQGDLSRLPPEHAVDALVVSAFPDDYMPAPGTLFSALRERGLDMREVARRKQEDERLHLGCWISEPLSRADLTRFNIGRIVCFEPRYRPFLKASGVDPDDIEDSIGFVFRCLNNFAIPEAGIAKVAMPVLATGNQGVPIEAMFPRLLESAMFWLGQGLPIEQLKIVAFSPHQASVARELFAAMSPAPHTPKDRRDPSSLPEPRTEGYDVFISYSHVQDREVAAFVEALRRHHPRLRIFHDRTAISVGATWLKEISDAIDGARTFIAVLSPEYTASPVCWDEFQCAKVKEYATGSRVIRTIRLYSEPSLPSMIAIHSYEDCVEGDLDKLKACAGRVIDTP